MASCAGGDRHRPGGGCRGQLANSGPTPPPADTPAAPPAPPSPAASSASPPNGDPSDAPPAEASAPGAPKSADATEPESGTAEDSTWAERDRFLNESNTLTGGSGLLRTQHAETGVPGQFRLGFVGEWFSAGFLCTPQFPCPNPTGGSPIRTDTLNHIGGTLTLGVSIAQLGPGILEGYASTEAYANSDAANQPALLQVLGDTDLGVKYVAPAGDVMRLGLFTELLFINGLGSVGLDDGGTSARFGGIATADLRGLSSPVPLRFSANFAYSLDNTGEVIADVETARGNTPITRIERYGLGINRVDHFDFLLGAEALLADERVRPFIETRIEVPNNRQQYECHQNNPSSDNCLLNDAVFPAILTIGGRFFPWKRGFSVLAALDIGLSGTSDFIEELQPVPPWTLFLGAGWAVDTVDRPPVVTKAAEPTVRPTVRVVGFVHEKDKNEPVANAIVSYPDHAELSPLATAADGRFGDDVPPGAYTFDIRAEGYKNGSCVANAVASPSSAGETPADATASAEPPAPSREPIHGGRAEFDIDCPLEALPRVGTVAGTARDADTSQPLGGLQVVLTDSQKKELRMATNPEGAFHFEGVSPGTAQLSVVADGYLAIVAPTDVKPRQESAVDLLLRPKPKRPQVQVTAKEITIRDQIQFALDSAVILPQSFGILTEVADTLIRRPEIKRLEIQGHTDNSGTADHNRTLSEERAEAVQAWLVQHGVPADRLESHGYGQDKPLVPNVTAGNRAQNRRVQFIILENAAGAPPSSGTSPAPERIKNPLPGF